MENKNNELFNLKGISKRRIELLKKMGIEKTLDLIRFFPRDYEDWTDTKSISDIRENTVQTLVGTVSVIPSLRRKGRMTILKTAITDSSGVQLTATWFNQPYFKDKLKVGEKYYFRGKVKRTGLTKEIINPVFEIINEDEVVGIKPVYKLTAGLTQGVIRKLVANALEYIPDTLKDPLPDEIRKEYKLCSVKYAYEKIHNPKNTTEFEIARKRLAFEELFLIQAGLALVRNTLVNKTKGFPVKSKKNILPDFENNLSFKLTDSQKQVINRILSDIGKDVPMNRLIQGDVGSGKTVVCAAAIYACVKSGYQAILMAPTTVLANQHYKTFNEYFKGLGIKVDNLTGGLSLKRKKEIYKKCESGEIDLLVGTHAVIQDDVKIKKLALAVTDEQHRFGVKQRSSLGAGKDTVPHVLVMSATPIPRTLGFVLYGDLDISVIKGLPKGRKPVETYTAKSSDDQRIYALIEKHIKQGRQVYVVCPMIETTQESDLKSAKDYYEQLKEEVFPQIRVGLMHGGLKQKEKENVMNEFMSGDISILVSTTVIEVGVDNPNATLMLIQNAERFGLAQLHQLRGRIGRGSHRSICILRSDTVQEEAIKRLKTLCKLSDGFEIAEQDMKFRGIGDFFGTRQHGIPEMKIANLYKDTQILSMAKKAVDDILEADPLLERIQNRYIIPMIKKQFGQLYDNIGL